MKKLLLSMLAFVTVTANAQEQFTEGPITYTITSPTTVEVSQLDNKLTGAVTIPEMVIHRGTNNYTVTSIGESACRWSVASSISIPETVDSIKKSAFSGSKFTTIRLPQNLRYIGPYAFSACPLTAIEVPATVETISDHAFFGSTTKPTLASITLHEGLKEIGIAAFYGSAIVEVEIPSTVTKLDKSVFLHCKNLKKVILHEGLTSIGDGAFNNCQKLTDITLPSTLKTLGTEVFLNNAALTKINIPASLESMDESCFGGSSLTTITVDPANQNFVVKDGVLYTKGYKVLQQAPLKGLKTYEVDSNCLGIAGGAFWGSELESIKLSDNVVAIGYGAFLGSQLKSIEWPKRLSFIDEQAFANTQFTEVTLPSTLYYIADGLFSGCTKLTKVTIPSGVTQVYPHAFSNCSSLATLVAQGSKAPELMPYYESYDAPFAGIASPANITVPKGATASYSKEGWGDFFRFNESALASLTVKNVSPKDSTSFGKYTSFSFSVTFNERIQIVNNHPDVYIRQDANYSATYIEPTGTPQWTAQLEGSNTLTVFGNDYDGFMDMFLSKKGKIYYVNIPAGIVKDDTGAVNDHITIVYYGQGTTTGIENVSVQNDSNSKVVARYNVNGQAVNEAQKGIQILKYADGTTRKVVVK